MALLSLPNKVSFIQSVDSARFAQNHIYIYVSVEKIHINPYQVMAMPVPKNLKSLYLKNFYTGFFIHKSSFNFVLTLRRQVLSINVILFLLVAFNKVFKIIRQKIYICKMLGNCTNNCSDGGTFRLLCHFAATLIVLLCSLLLPLLIISYMIFMY